MKIIKHILYLKLLIILIFILNLFIITNIHAEEMDNWVACYEAKFSPDGNKIVFVSDIQDSGELSFWLMETDGRDLKKLPLQGRQPSWSPDNSKLVFMTGEDLWIVNIDGTNLIQLTNDKPREDFPSWSPDGTKVAFCNGDGDLALMNIDGTGQKKLTSGNYPTWSPDGTQLAYFQQSDSTGEHFNIWKIKVDGTGETQLTFGDYADVDPVWSPDGSQIAFSSDRSGEGQEIWTMLSNGSGLLQLTHTGSGWSPSWSSDGTKIIFGVGNITEVDVYTGKERQITHFQAYRLPFQQFSLKHWRIHWDQGKHDKNKFQLSGRIDLPDDYTLDMLQKKGIVAIAIEKKDGAPFSQTATLDFKQHGPVWHYKAPKAQNGTGCEPLDIEKMLIFWQPEGLEGKPDKQGHAGKGHGKRAGWFMIQGNINISDTEQAALLPKAVLTLNIPVENITTTGALESREEIEFKVHNNLWGYNAAPHNRWQDWQESWWEKVKED